MRVEGAQGTRGAGPITAREAMDVAAAAALSIFVHALFVIHGFGEPDAARLAVQAAAWHNTGVPIEAYTVRVSPLYLQVLKWLLDLGLPLPKLPAVMNWASVVTGGLALVPMYFLWRRLAGVTAAVVAGVLFWFTPAFWLGNIYGMPHVPSFFFFLTALLAFAAGIERSGPSGRALLAVSAVCACVAMALKADIVLCCGAFVGVAFALRALTWRNAVLAIVIPFVAVVVTVGEARWIVQLDPAGQFVTSWSRRFPFTVEALRNPANRRVPVDAVGAVFFYGVVAAVAYCAVFRKHVRLLLLALAWALPAMLLWGLKMGNSARHLMASYSVLMLVVALVIDPGVRSRRWRWLASGLVLAFLAVNYFSAPPSYSTISPSPRLAESAGLIQREYVDRFHYSGRKFAEVPGKKIYLGRVSRPYVQWEVFVRSGGFEFVPGRRITEPWDTYVPHPGGEMDTVRTVYIWETPYTVDRRQWPLISTTEQALHRYIRVIE